MINPPLTPAAAREVWYGPWYRLAPYNSDQCAYSLMRGFPWMVDYQCIRSPGHGPSDLYCKQHARKIRCG